MPWTYTMLYGIIFGTAVKTWTVENAAGCLGTQWENNGKSAGDSTKQWICWKTWFTIFDLDKMSFCFHLEVFKTSDCLPAKSGTSQNCLARKKSKKVPWLEKINSKMLSDPESWVVSNNLLSYQITSSRGFLTTGHAPLHGPKWGCFGVFP